MSSVGQVVGGIVGGVIGFFAGGNVMLGASIGMAIGGAIDPPKGPDIKGPRLNDLSFQTATLGAPIPRIYGKTAVFGNIFWLENNQLKETITTKKQGGKGGGPSSTVETYSYSATFALGLCEGPIDGIGRIWIGGKLVYGSGASTWAEAAASSMFRARSAFPVPILSGSAFGSGSPNPDAPPRFTLYTGSATQQPDPRMQMTLGVGNTPAYRGLAYILFEDLELENYGNSLLGAQVKVEVIKSGQTDWVTEQSILNVVPTITTNQMQTWTDGLTSYFFYGFVTGTLYEDRCYVMRGNDNTTYELYANWLYPFTPDEQPGFVRFGRTVRPYMGLRYLQNGKYYCYVTNIAGQTECRFQIGSAVPSCAGIIHSNAGTTGYWADGTTLSIGLEDFNTQQTVTLPFIPHDSAWDDTNIYLAESASDGVALKLAIVNRQTLAVSSVTAISSFQINYPSVCVAEGCVWVTTGAGTVNGRVFRYDGVTFEDYAPVRFYVNGAGYGHCFVKWGSSFYLTGSKSNIGSSAGNIAVCYSSFSETANTTLGSIVSAESLLSGVLSAGDIDVTDLTQPVRGYTISSVAALRSSIEQLRGAWPFDATTRGYKLHYVSRGKSPVATIEEDELGANDRGDLSKQIRLTSSREMETQLPRKVVIRYTDANREYDIGSGAGAQRINTTSVNHLELEMPIVLTADEAAQMEERLLYMYWLERVDYSFSLPPTYEKLEPADVVTINTSSGIHQVRIISVNILPNGIVECTGKPNAAAVYNSSAVGQEGLYVGRQLAFIGSTALVLFDIPSVLDGVTEYPGFGAGMSGYVAGWPGATLYRFSDADQTWVAIDAASNETFIGACTTNFIGPPQTPLLIDKQNVLEVTPVTGALFNVTELEMLNGANHFAYGADGRWEIIAAQDCVLTSGVYRLSNLLRGRFGSERFMATHAIGDRIVELDPSSTIFAETSVGAIGVAAVYRAITKGGSLSASTEYSFTYGGENLKPLSPVYAAGWKNAAGDWNISWVRRTRVGGELRDGIATPLGETIESYDVEIYGDEGFTAVKRTFPGLATPTFTYTAAQQTADFGATIPLVPVKIYQNSSNIGRGTPLAANVATDGGRLFSESHLVCAYSGSNDYDVAAYNYPALSPSSNEYLQKFKEYESTGIRYYNNGSPGAASNSGVLATVTLPISTVLTYYLHASNSYGWDECSFSLEFLDASGNLVACIETTPPSYQYHYIKYGTTKPAGTLDGGSGNRQTEGEITFSSSQVIFTNIRVSNYQNSFTINCAANTITSVRISGVKVMTSLTTNSYAVVVFKKALTPL